MLKANDPCWCRSGRKYKRCHKDATRLAPGRVSARRHVPDGIPAPHYAARGEGSRRGEPMVKPPEVLAAMRRTGRIAAAILAETGDAVAPGVTTDELDRIAHEAHVRRGVYPSPLGYRGFPKSICTSVNEVICHGIPDDRPLVEGDIVNIDVTTYAEGVHGDTNATFCVGRVDEGSRLLVRVTRECLERGIAAVGPGRPLSEIGRAIEEHATRHGFSVVRTFVGHGIGREFHTEPSVPHYHDPSLELCLEPGMTFTIEPMIAMGDPRERIWPDGWTAVTADGLRCAQFEHTVAVTDDGVEVLTAA